MAISEENAGRILRVFEKFGCGEIGITQADFLKADHVVEIGREPRKIQLLTGIDGVHFKECAERKVDIVIGGVSVKFFGKADLIRNKAASGRPKDLIDVEELEKL